MRAFVSSRMATTTVLALLVPTLVHFASAAPAPKEPAPKEEESATVQESDEIEAGEELRAVLTQPLDDFNLTRKEIPPELVRIVASFAQPAAKVAMERASREWRSCVLPRHWVADLRAFFSLDYAALKPAGRPEPKRLFAMLETARRDLARGGRGSAPGSGRGGRVARPPAVFAL